MIDQIFGFLSGLWNGMIDGLSNLFGNLGFDDVLSNIVGFIPRSIAFFTSLIAPIGALFSKWFGNPLSQATGTVYMTLLLSSVCGFIIILGIRRGVFK